MLNPDSDEKLNLSPYRIIYFIMFLGVLSENAVVPLPAKYNLVIAEGYVVIAVIGVLLLSSFLIKYVQRHFNFFHLLTGMLVSAWVTHFAFVNGFGIFDIISFLIIIPLFNLTLTRQRYLAINSFFFIAAFLTALGVSPGFSFVRGSLTKYDLVVSITAFAGMMFFVARSRLMAVEALTRAKESFETIFQHSTDALFVLKPDTLAITNFNDEASHLFGIKNRENVIGSGFLHYIKNPSQADRARAAAIRQAVLKEGQWKLDSKFGMFDQIEIWGEIALRPVSIENQEMWLARVVDIGRRKILEEELELKVQERTELINQVLNNNPSLIYVKDYDGRYSLANQSLADLLGTTTADFIGKTDEAFGFSTVELLAQLKEDREVIDSLQPKFLPEVSLVPHTVKENRFNTPAPARWFQSVKVPLVSPHLKLKNVLGVLTDITARKNAELRARQLDELKDNFIKIVSHQLRTPLASVGWNLELILDQAMGPLTPEQKETLSLAYQSDREVISRVGDLILALDIEEGRTKVTKKPVNLAKLLAKALKDQKKTIELKRIKLSLDLPPTLPEVEVDLDKIVAVFKVLLENAVGYTPESGWVRLRLGLKDNQLRFEVEDSGVGIPEAEKSKVFERFFRATNAFLVRPNSSGLGLFIAKNFVEAQGGKIGFQSSEGKGSTFWFELPLA